MTAEVIEQQRPAEHAGTYGTARVWTTEWGAPTKFIYDGRRLAVCARPIYWVGRREQNWWTAVRRLPEQGGSALLERRMYRVDAKDVDTGEILSFDLELSEGKNWPATAL